MTTKQISIRMPMDLLQELRKQRPGSGSSFIVEAVRDRLNRERELKLQESLQALAFEGEENDLSWIEGAQLEVFRSND